MSSATAPLTVSIDLADRSYDIAIAPGLLSQPATFAACPKAAQALIVTRQYQKRQQTWARNQFPDWSRVCPD